MITQPEATFPFLRYFAGFARPKKNKMNDIDQYIAGFPQNIQVLLNLIRKTIQDAAPESVEVISYGMPAFKQMGMLVYFAGYKNHIGFYPTASGIRSFKERLTDYKWSKGAIQFPINQDLPIGLITEIVLFRLSENMGKTLHKKIRNERI
jgi:uncharacterized protein YdhG (YjbR/CyaY superfamily)